MGSSVGEWSATRTRQDYLNIRRDPNEITAYGAVCRVISRTRRLPPSDIGDPDAGVRLVAAVDADQVRGERLDLVGVAQPAAVQPADAGDDAGQVLDQVGRLSNVAEDQDVGVDRRRFWVLEQDRAHVVERT